MQPFSILPSTGIEQFDEWIRLGCEAHLVGNLPKAEGFYRHALRLSPGNATALHNLAILQASAGNLNEALLTMERATLFEADHHPVIFANQALICLEADRIDEGIRAAVKAMSLAQTLDDPAADPIKSAGYLNARLAYAMMSPASGHPENAYPAYMEMLAVDPTNANAGPNLCFVATLMPIGPKELLVPRQKWYTTNKPKRPQWPLKRDKSPDRPLRVGYVGGDFKNHSAAMMFANVVLNHDRTQVEPYLYSSLPTNAEQDESTARFHACGNWRDISAKSDDDAEAVIDADQLDVMVDLAGHTSGGRLGLFCRKLAPIQVTAWGFAHGTGVPEIDVFFADPVAVPVEERQHFVERIVDLPCIVTYRPPTEYQLKPSSPAPYFQNEYITFGTFTRFEKLSDGCLATFKRILEGVPDSRLYLKDHAFKRPYSIRRILKALEGIDPKRLIFAGSSSHPEHMLEYGKVDLMLDVYPHGAGVVSLETLYCGVPLVTMYGTQPGGRTASSVLTAIGRKDWIARSEDEYVELAIAWANRPHELAKARKTLRDELLNSPVVNGYAGEVEKAYRMLWEEWCAK